LGDPSRAHEKLGWQPRISFEEMVQEMMQTDLELARRDDLVEREGFRAYRHFE
ncbi:MAG TPA: GDP-mannose 4,6-dehydratase, partial [Chromatiales bacterium]|nr:GDP-mannose 4,6-dehydratase [Chromatiales bacterium]